MPSPALLHLFIYLDSLVLIAANTIFLSEFIDRVISLTTGSLTRGRPKPIKSQ